VVLGVSVPAPAENVVLVAPAPMLTTDGTVTAALSLLREIVVLVGAGCLSVTVHVVEALLASEPAAQVSEFN